MSTFGKKDVISLKNSSSGNKRFYVMALTDALDITIHYSKVDFLPRNNEWTVPSVNEWAAFADRIVTSSNYSTYGLSPYYWTSSSSINSDLWYWINLSYNKISDNGKFKYEVVDDSNYVRWAKQF